MRDLFHTKIGPALRDPTTWVTLAGGMTAAAALPSPWSYIVGALTVPGALLKTPGGGNAGPAQ
jgi:hypothetical protein